MPHSRRMVSHPWTGPRDGDGVGAEIGDLLESLVGQLSQRGGCGSTSAAVDSADALVLVVPDQREHVAADAGGDYLHHIQDRGGGNRCVHGIPAVHENPQTGHGAQRLAGGDHSVLGQDHGTPRIEEHGQLRLQVCAGHFNIGPVGVRLSWGYRQGDRFLSVQI